jgi:hypothetical protein
LPQFQVGDDSFIAIAKTGKNPTWGDEFLKEFYRLADRTRYPDGAIAISRKGYCGPEREPMFLSPHSGEWLLWEPSGSLSGFATVAADVWNVLPFGQREQYRPLHPLGDNWRPWQPTPAWEFIYLAFRRLQGVGDLVRERRIGNVELLYFSVGVFRACGMAIELMAPPSPTFADLQLAPGGFTCRSDFHELTGRPLDMLRALLSALDHRLTADQLRVGLRINDEEVEFPQQVVRDMACKLRAVLRKAWEQAGVPMKNPLPHSGSGRDLSYALQLPPPKSTAGG